MSKIALEPNVAGTGTFSIAAPNSNTNRTLTLPDETGTVLTSVSAIPAANLTGALPAIDGSALTGLSSGGMTLLGTLATTSGTTQTFSGLSLSGYVYLFIIVSGVSSQITSPLIFGGMVVSPSIGAAASASGLIWLNLANGWASSAVSGAADSVRQVQTPYTGASTSISFYWSGGDFDAGEISIYGVK
jgi:hypothetical protein